MTPEKRMTIARASMLLSQPFFASLVMRMRMVESDDLPTLATDGDNIYYNPKFTESLSATHLQAVLAHEALHVALLHLVRRGDRDPMGWNIAGDYAINLVLKDSGFDLPKDALIDTRYAGKSADEIYNMLPKEQRGGQGKSQPQQGSGNNQDAGPGQGQKPGQGHQGHKNQKGQCACGGMREPKNLDPSEIRRIEAEMRKMLAQARSFAAGNMPGSLRRMIDGLLEPKVNWQALLRNFFEQVFKGDYSFTHPNRRYVGQGFCLPSLYSKEMEEIVVMVDTSGSISGDMINQFASEITAILATVNVSKVHVVYCDAAVAHVQEFQRDDLPLKIEAKGGGGTDFRPPFKWVTDQGLEPACAIYLTDLYCHSYPVEPMYPVLWVTPTMDTARFKPPFGDVIQMS